MLSYTIDRSRDLSSSMIGITCKDGAGKEFFAPFAQCEASNGDISIFYSVVKHEHAIEWALLKNAPILSALFVSIIPGKHNPPRTARMIPPKARGQVAIEASEHRILLGHSLSARLCL